jgi:uncharacterized zinc-type alcohol dehydrogenase-like protein
MSETEVMPVDTSTRTIPTVGYAAYAASEDPNEPAHVPAFTLALQRRNLAGSIIGGIAETQEMLDYCAAHQITADVEVINISDINKAFERMEKSDVKYRFVIDLATL